MLSLEQNPSYQTSTWAPNFSQITTKYTDEIGKKQERRWCLHPGTDWSPVLRTRRAKTDSDTEIIWVQITVTGNSYLYVGAFYRPPNIDSPDYLASLENAIPRIPPNAHELFSSLDKGIQTDMIILDFSKAFVRVPYRRLLKKTHHYGIRGNTHKYRSDGFSTYLVYQENVCWLVWAKIQSRRQNDN